MKVQSDLPSPQKVASFPKPGGNSSLDLDTIMTVIKTAIGPAIQSAMALYAEKITALERATMQNTEGNAESHHSIRECPSPKGVEMSIWAPTNHTQCTNKENNTFTLVTHNEQSKKAKGKMKANASAPTPASQANPTPAVTRGQRVSM